MNTATSVARQNDKRVSAWRRTLVLAVFGAAALALGYRAVDLQLLTREFLQTHGDARYLHTVEPPAHRAMIRDRNGEPLAISTPVKSVWGVPGQLLMERGRWRELAQLLGVSTEYLDTLITPRAGRDFVYLKRHVPPELAARIKAAGIHGVGLTEEYKRYYPSGEITAHVVGFTNVDDEGQEGVELAFNEQLRGKPGAKRVIKDRLGRIVEDVEEIRAAEPGTPLTLSIDRRLQYIAYRELKAAVQQNRARAGSAVIIDPWTGEVLAMVNQPSFNPNNRAATSAETYRNRVVTDLLEPGSTVKPFTIAAALESGRFRPETLIDTGPGYFKVGRHTVQDIHDYGTLDLTGVIEKSSNVGAAKIALALEPEALWNMFRRAGFGLPVMSGFPGEAGGRLNDYHHWREIEQATAAFGYGLSVTVLHLVRAYGAIATDGRLRPISLVKLDQAVDGEPVMREETARALRVMLERVVEGGTAGRARVAGYRVAGKTGTVHKNTDQGYADDRYISTFAGILPLSAPKLVAVISIDEPRGEGHFGGQVAAPIFAAIMSEATRILNIPADADWPPAGQRLADAPEPPRGIFAEATR